MEARVTSEKFFNEIRLMRLLNILSQKKGRDDDRIRILLRCDIFISIEKEENMILFEF